MPLSSRLRQSEVKLTDGNVAREVHFIISFPFDSDVNVAVLDFTNPCLSCHMFDAGADLNWCKFVNQSSKILRHVRYFARTELPDKSQCPIPLY
jgi:hypothetical protein